VNARLQDGTGALRAACHAGSPEAALLCLDAGADVNARAKDGLTALGMLDKAPAGKDRDDVAALLAARGATR